jgi:thiamine-monophosphate kinase
MADRFDTYILGGDVTSRRGRIGLSVSVFVLGEADSQGPVRRSGGSPGDVIMVTGALGGASLGKHLNFTPRVREGMFLKRNFAISAMIDISDGLLQDLQHLLAPGCLGAQLHRSRIPIARAARKLSRQTGRPPLEHALTDGEDFELLFTVSADQVGRIARRQRELGVRVSAIGMVTERAGIFMRDQRGRNIELTVEGYQHHLRM